MPLLITEMQLDSAEFLSLVDKGASGDNDSRPSIVLFKRHKDGNMDDVTILEKIRRLVGMNVAKMETPQPVEAGKMDPKAKLEELGLSEEQVNAILEMLALAAKPAEAPAAVPVAAAAPDAQPAEQPKEEEQPMAKQSKLELEKRDAEIVELKKMVKTLSDDAEMVKIEKRADELKFIPGKSREEIIEMVKACKGDEAMLGLLDTINEAGRTSPVLQVIGEKEVSGTEGEVKIAKRAAEIMAADPKISAAKAKVQAWRENESDYRAAKSGQ